MRVGGTREDEGKRRGEVYISRGSVRQNRV